MRVCRRLGRGRPNRRFAGHRPELFSLVARHLEGPTVLRIEGLPFSNATIVLDGHHFVRCQFKNVNLVIRGADPFNLEGCTFDQYAIVFEGAAATTVSALAAMYGGGFQTVIEGILESIRKNNIPVKDGSLPDGTR